MKGSGYLNWMRRLIVLGAVVAGVTAASAGAMRPVEIGGTPTGNTNVPTVVSRPPDVSDVAARLSPTTALGLKADGLRYQAIAQAYGESGQVAAPDAFERYASAHPYGVGLPSGTDVAVRPPDVSDVAARLSPTTALGLKADGLRYQAIAQAYGVNGQVATPSGTDVAVRPPDVTDAAFTAAQGGGSVIETSGFDWTDWAIGIGTGLGLVLLLGIGFAMSRQMRQHPQPA